MLRFAFVKLQFSFMWFNYVNFPHAILKQNGKARVARVRYKFPRASYKDAD